MKQNDCTSAYFVVSLKHVQEDQADWYSLAIGKK